MCTCNRYLSILYWLGLECMLSNFEKFTEIVA